MSQQINLLNSRLVRKRYAFTVAAGMLPVLALAVLMSGGYAAYEHHRITELRRQAAALEASYRQVAARHEALGSDGTGGNAGGEPELSDLAARLKMRQHVMAILRSGAAGSTAGFSEYLRAFSRQAVDGLWLTGFDIAEGGAELTLTGRTLSADLVPTYLSRLHREPPMQGRHFASMRISEPKPAEPAAPVQHPGGQAAAVAPAYLEFAISTGGLGEENAARTPEQREGAQDSPVARLLELLTAPGGTPGVGKEKAGK